MTAVIKFYYPWNDGDPYKEVKMNSSLMAALDCIEEEVRVATEYEGAYADYCLEDIHHFVAELELLDWGKFFYDFSYIIENPYDTDNYFGNDAINELCQAIAELHNFIKDFI